jgi:hypothetical protein
MIKLDEIRATKLIELAQERFATEISDAERKVLRDSAGSDGPSLPEADAERPEVRPEFVRWLATDREAAIQIDPKGLRVYGVTLPGNLDLQECLIGIPLDIRGSVIKGKIDLRWAETRDIYLLDCSVEGAFSADGLDAHGPILLRWSRFTGKISLPRARIKNDLDCSGAKLEVNEGAALSIDGAEIGGSVFLREGLRATGEILLLGARIKGVLACSGAKLEVKEGDALSADRAEIGGSVFLDKGFHSLRTIRLVGTQIGGQLNFLGAEISDLICANLCLSEDMYWLGIRNSEKAFLDLTGTRMRNLRDDRESWPAKGKLVLDGLVYEEISLHRRPTDEEIEKGVIEAAMPLDADSRIEWLKIQAPGRRTEAQPWMQLSKHLEDKGDHEGAKHVLYKFRCLQAQESGLLLCGLRIVFAWLEEAPARILWFIGATLLLFTAIFWHAGAAGALAPTEKDAYEAFTSGKPMPAAYPALNPFIYTLENALPLAKLGQDEKWAPDRRYPSTTWPTNYWFLMWARWVLVVWGWFQAGILGAALVNRFKP